MASSSSPGQPKSKKLRKSCDDSEFALPATAPSPQPVRPSKSLIMTSSALAESTSSSGRKYQPYDIFISHFGIDTKDTLANNLYKMLDNAGLRVFLDKDDVVLGDSFPRALEKAIVNASLHIAIFSPNYAQSPWCLAELTLMLQTGIPFVPVFYHVEPSTLQWAILGKGVYADAFDKHEKNNRYSIQMLQSWKSALRNASFYLGERIIDP